MSAAEAALNEGSATKERFEELGKDLAEKLNAFQQSQAQEAAASADPEANVADEASAEDDEEVIDADFKPAG